MKRLALAVALLVAGCGGSGVPVRPLAVSAVDDTLPLVGAWHGRVYGQIASPFAPGTALAFSDHLDLTISSTAVQAWWDAHPIRADLVMVCPDSVRFRITYFGPDSSGGAAYFPDGPALWFEGWRGDTTIGQAGLYGYVDCPQLAPVVCGLDGICWRTTTIGQWQVNR